jgi:hypothetical protein
MRNGSFVSVGSHAQFLIAGMPTLFTRASGEAVTISGYVYLLNNRVKAPRLAAGRL